MKRSIALENTSPEEIAQAVEFEKQRLQQQKDSPTLPDPEDNGALTVPRQTPVTPALVQQSVDVLVRNKALKELSIKENQVDETKAKENIEEAKDKSFETKAPTVKEDKPKTVK